MSDEQNVNEEQQVADDENTEAYGFWIYAFGVIGAVIGYNIGAEVGFTFWVNLGFGFVGLVALAIVAYKFRKTVAIVGGIAVVVIVVIAIVEGIQSA
ncbi:MAG: hypothetical protein GY781_04765 [Gammaproteobacteria bacterium]|nr:hypothetical protein [Gammaproteobacteria bacterium]